MTYIGARSAGVCKGGIPLAMFSLGVPVSLTYIKEMGTYVPRRRGGAENGLVATAAKRRAAARTNQNSLVF